MTFRLINIPQAFCGNSSFEWNMQHFNNIRSFVLGIEHSFEDAKYVDQSIVIESTSQQCTHSVGQPPYDEITNFARANISESTITCKATSGLQMCEQTDGTTIIAPIYATIAKR